MDDTFHFGKKKASESWSLHEYQEQYFGMDDEDHDEQRRKSLGDQRW